jgi:hypothetical protein
MHVSTGFELLSFELSYYHYQLLTTYLSLIISRIVLIGMYISTILHIIPNIIYHYLLCYVLDKANK